MHLVSASVGASASARRQAGNGDGSRLAGQYHASAVCLVFFCIRRLTVLAKEIGANFDALEMMFPIGSLYHSVSRRTPSPCRFLHGGIGHCCRTLLGKAGSKFAECLYPWDGC